MSDTRDDPADDSPLLIGLKSACKDAAARRQTVAEKALELEALKAEYQELARSASLRAARVDLQYRALLDHILELFPNTSDRDSRGDQWLLQEDAENRGKR